MDGYGQRERATNQKMGRERERARIYKVVVERNNKKMEKNEYFIEISCKIDKLMWVFYKSDSVKQKKYVFPCKIDRKFRRTDVDALSMWVFIFLLFC